MSPSPLIAGFFVSLVALGFLSTGCAKRAPLPVVQSVDLNRYQGLWYEIARYPHWFEKGCVGATAQYTLQDDGTVLVVNRCFEGTLEGQRKEARAKAWSVDPATHAKLKVRFFWPFTGRYWIIGLAEDYSYAVVGEPGRKYLWILCRTPVLEETVYQSLLSDVAAKGFDPSQLERPPQKRQEDLETLAREAPATEKHSSP